MIRLPIEREGVRFDPAPDARVELRPLGRRVLVPVGSAKIGEREILRAHLIVDARREAVRMRLHLRALRQVLVVDVGTIDALVRVLLAAKGRAAAIGRAA